jgi:hypothetical protein
MYQAYCESSRELHLYPGFYPKYSIRLSPAVNEIFVMVIHVESAGRFVARLDRNYDGAIGIVSHTRRQHPRPDAIKISRFLRC